MTDKLSIGRRDSVVATAIGSVLLGGVFPGLGVLFVPVMVADGFSVGFAGWIAVWAYVPFGLRRMFRVHRVEGDQLVSTYQRRTITRSLADVALLSAGPFYLPAARVQFDDGSAFWAWGPNTERVLAAVVEHAEHADNQLPPTGWLRPRRIVWFVVAFALGAWSDS